MGVGGGGGGRVKVVLAFRDSKSQKLVILNKTTKFKENRFYLHQVALQLTSSLEWLHKKITNSNP